jgi:hypothetical protein
MYTVARCFASGPEDPLLCGLVANLNAIEGAAWLRLRARGDGYAAALCKADHWSAHVAAISGLLSTHADAIRAFTDAGGRVDIDALIGPEDVGDSQLWTTLAVPAELSGALGKAGAVMSFTVTAGATGEEGWST